MANEKTEYERLKNFSAALEHLIEALEEPMKIVSEIDNSKLKLMIGELSANIIGKIDYEIKPFLNKQD